MSLCDFGDVWWKGVYTEYFHSVNGQIEYWLVMLLAGGYRMALSKLPLNWYGKYNELGLYLVHWAYSPFVEYDP